MPRARSDRPRLVLYRGSYAIQWSDGGERRRLATGTTNETRARQALADFEDDVERHSLRLTVDQALTRYEANRATKVMALSRLQEAARPLREALGALRVDQVTQARWDRYVQERCTKRPTRAKPDAPFTPRAVSPGTLRREFNVLRAALRLAWKDGYLTKPPVLEAPADSTPRDRFMTKDEARRLLAACTVPHVRVFMALAFYTGARRTSILSLRWEQVDFRTGTVDFQIPGRQVTGKRRAIVPMNASLRAELEGAKRVAESDYVVEYAGKPVPSGLRWSWQRLCKRAGLTWLPTLHHIKHSVASWLAMEGIPIDQAADLMATDPKTLRRVYRKFDPTYLRTAVGGLEL